MREYTIVSSETNPFAQLTRSTLKAPGIAIKSFGNVLNFTQLNSVFLFLTGRSLAVNAALYKKVTANNQPCHIIKVKVHFFSRLFDNDVRFDVGY